MMSSYSRPPLLSLSAAQKKTSLPGWIGGPGGNGTRNVPDSPPCSPAVSLSGMATSFALTHDAILIAYAANAVNIALEGKRDGQIALTARTTHLPCRLHAAPHSGRRCLKRC